MQRNDALRLLGTHAEDIRAMGATSLNLYGSVASGDAGSTSDVDLFMDYDPESRFNAFDLVGIKQYLEDKLAVAVDLTTRDGLHPRLRARIEKVAIRVF